MSYGTQTRAEKKIVCLECRKKDYLSQTQQMTHIIYKGKSQRYLCTQCYLEKQLKRTI